MTTNPVRLHKKMTLKEEFENWCLNHSSIILFICIILFGMLFATLILALFGTTSGVESGLQYNKFERII